MWTLAAGTCAVLAVCWVAVLYWRLRLASWDTARAELKGARCLVTGSSSGIGAEIARHLARCGAHVVLTAPPAEQTQLEAVAAACSSLGAAGVHIVTADLGSRPACARLVGDSAAALGGGLDLVVLNHFFPLFEPWETTMDLAERKVQVDFLAYAFVAEAALPVLDSSPRGGRLAVVSSVAGWSGVPYAALYSACKHAVMGFFRSLRMERAMLCPASRVSITLCTLGNIDTATARRITRVREEWRGGGRSIARSRSNPLLSFAIPPNKGHLRGAALVDAESTAGAVVRGLARRMANMYYPLADAYLAVSLLGIFPWLVEQGIMRTIGIRQR